MHKKIVYIIFIIALVISCKTERKEKGYFTISGKIDNNTVDSLYLFNFDREEKVIKIKPDGTFSDTFKIKNPGLLYLNHGRKQLPIYARNGYDVHFTWDANLWVERRPGEILKITGYGSEVLNYFTYDGIRKYDWDFFENEERYYQMSKSEFKQKWEDNLAISLSNMPKSDTAFVSYYTKSIDGTLNYYLKQYDKKKYIATVLAKGLASPKFNDYENYDGSRTSLDDFKGNYAFIDVWATWCKPCIKEIPFIQTLEKKYHDKNIKFVSISIDKEKDYDKWRQMIADKELTGIQLLADKGPDSDFMKAYKTFAVPHFILIDPEGNIVTHKAPLPSNEKEIDSLFNELDLKTVH